jgi:hypothetical protein
MKRHERDIYSPNTGKKYVNSPDHQRPRVDERSRRSNNAKGISQNMPSKLTRLPDMPWTKDEDEKLIKGAVTNDCNWKKVQILLPTRTMDQCQLRWQQIGANRIGDQWTNMEDRVLTEIVQASDEVSWPVVTDMLLSRTGSLRLVRQCRDRWNLVLEPRLKQKEQEINNREAESGSTVPDDAEESESDEDDDVSPAHIQLNSPRWEDLPSIGSAGHAHGLCKRCCFYPKGRCLNGYSCNFCHFPHEKRIRKNKHKNRQSRDRTRTHRQSDDAWHSNSKEWFGDDDWVCTRVPQELPTFSAECGVHMNIPGEVTPMMQASVAPTMLPCMPPTRDSSVPSHPGAGQEYAFDPQNGDEFLSSHGYSELNFCVQRFMSQDSAQSASFSETMPAVQQALPMVETTPTSDVPTELHPNFDCGSASAPCPCASSECLDADEVFVWLEGIMDEYQFTKEDLTGFFGSYGHVAQVELVKGGGGSVKFSKPGIAAKVVSDLDSVQLPALGHVLRVQIVTEQQ